ncbi:MAG: substrate-binding periplasmic protein, partial [Anaerotignum sp.]
MALEDNEQKVVRVGFFPCPFNIKDENGHLSGYAYDYQQDIAAYTGWKYEYVEATWPELLQMLKDGEIDLLSDVSITPEREKEMLFSSYDMGKEAYYLYVSTGETGIDVMNPATLEGKRIGVNAGSIQADLFREWTQSNGVQVEAIPCNGDDAMVEMLAAGELDAVVAIDAYTFENTVPMARIGDSAFYFAINSARPDLKVELDEAMHLLLSANRFYNEGLYRQYLNANVSKSLPAEDLQWLQKHGKVRVGYLDHYLAYCDKDDTTGAFGGALHEFLSSAESCLYNAVLVFES